MADKLSVGGVDVRPGEGVAIRVLDGGRLEGGSGLWGEAEGREPYLGRAVRVRLGHRLVAYGSEGERGAARGAAVVGGGAEGRRAPAG